MVSPGRATILYSTGTGNTARAAGVIGEELSRSGWSVNAEELRVGAGNPQGTNDADLLVLCFPVLGFGPPALVRTRLTAVRGKGRPAAVFATWGGDGVSALWLARRLLRRRGFRVVAAAGATYPFQWTQVIAPPPEPDSRRMIIDGDAAARSFAGALAANLRAGRTTRGGATARDILPLLLELTLWPLYNFIGRFGLRSMFAADQRCTACGKCVKNCPAGSIMLTGSGPRRRPQWRAGCLGCNRCINLCARAAVQTSPVRAGVHLVLNIVLIAAIVVGLNRAAAAASLPASLSVAAYIVLLLTLSVVLSRIQFWALEPVLFALEGIPAFRKLIGRSWTARFPRYRCEGFQPQLPG
jgi:Pyruvate/2-oxoacid:ferredoxin oxidoreductase delta subunit